MAFEVSLFKDKYVAEALACKKCRRVSHDARMTPCKHLFCCLCTQDFLNVADSCPICDFPLLEQDLQDLSGYLLNILNSLHLKCPSCAFEDAFISVREHCMTCKKISRGHLNKTPLSEVNMKTLIYKRMKGIIPQVEQLVDSFCTTATEEKTEIYFGLLVAHLHSLKDPKLDKILQIWRSHDSEHTKLSAEMCVALRVNSIQSKQQYSFQFASLKKAGCNPLRSLAEINAAEKKFLPGHVRYGVEGDEPSLSVYHTPAKIDSVKNAVDPIDIMADFPKVFPEGFSPNVCGVRWCYADCLAKTLEELDSVVTCNLGKLNLQHSSDFLYKVFVKDGCDGMGDISVYRQISDRRLPDKAFRASFCIVKIDAICPQGKFVVFEETEPNSVRTNRPLLEAVCDENDSPSTLVCIVPIEAERKFLTGKILAVQCNGIKKRFEIDFYTSMIDEKLDRAESGLQASGSNYICTLCHATRETAVSNVGEFVIDRTFEETKEIAEYIRLNPDNLSKKSLEACSKGVKSLPILLVDAVKKGIDATHADINIGRFFKNLLCREIAKIFTWTLTSDVKDLIVHAEKQLDQHLKSKIGLNAHLMMPGNYARVLFEERNVEVIVQLIPCEERRNLVKGLLEIFRELRAVYRSNNPLLTMPEQVTTYKVRAIALANMLKTDFSYVHWPNYLHKIIEHVQELIQRPDGPGTVGGMSGEGNEAGNKIFRHFRKNLSRKGATFESLHDVLKLHWLYSSPLLTKLAQQERSSKQCSLCNKLGHNIRTCKKSTFFSSPQ